MSNMLKLLSTFLLLSVILATVLAGATPPDKKHHQRKHHHHQPRIHVGKLLKELKSLDGGSMEKLRQLMAKSHVLAKITSTRKPNKSHLTLISPSMHALRKVHIVGKNPAIARLLKEMFGDKKGTLVVERTLWKPKLHKQGHKPAKAAPKHKAPKHKAPKPKATKPKM